MPVKTEILDGNGTGRTAQVTDARALLVSVLPVSSRGIPAEDLSNLRQLREAFRDASGSDSQIVDGSASPVEFQISAGVAVTKWITGFRLILQGQNADITTQDFRRYAQKTSPGLTNGIDIETFQGGVTTSITQAGAIVKLGDWLRYSDDFVGLVSAISSSIDYIHFDFAFDRPVVLAEGSSDALMIRINDDLTAALAAANSAQYAIARGYQESL
jgi:hypothetical protein